MLLSPKYQLLTIILIGVALAGCQKNPDEEPSLAEPQTPEAFVLPPPAPKPLPPLDVKGTQAIDEAMARALPHYLQIQATLAQDTLTKVAENAKAFQAEIAKISSGGLQGEDQERYRMLLKEGPQLASMIAEKTELSEVRELFKRLSFHVTAWVRTHLPDGIEVVFCSMAPGGWAQAKGTIQNPYHGKAMLECGEKMLLGAPLPAKSKSMRDQHRTSEMAQLP